MLLRSSRPPAAATSTVDLVGARREQTSVGQWHSTINHICALQQSTDGGIVVWLEGRIAVLAWMGVVADRQAGRGTNSELLECAKKASLRHLHAMAQNTRAWIPPVAADGMGNEVRGCCGWCCGWVGGGLGVGWGWCCGCCVLGVTSVECVCEVPISRSAQLSPILSEMPTRRRLFHAVATTTPPRTLTRRCPSSSQPPPSPLSTATNHNPPTTNHQSPPMGTYP